MVLSMREFLLNKKENDIFLAIMVGKMFILISTVFCIVIALGI